MRSAACCCSYDSRANQNRRKFPNEKRMNNAPPTTAASPRAEITDLASNAAPVATRAQITDLSADILRKEDAVSKYEERLKAQYAALDGLLKRLQSQSSSLLQSNSSNGN